MYSDSALSAAWWYYAALVTLLGLCVGSFLNVVIYRVPLKLSIIKPPSHCPNCQTRLKPLDMVPVLSYIFLGGRCRTCKKGISPRYMLVELLTGALFLLCYWRLPLWTQLLPALVLASVLVATAFIDAEHSIIPNGLVLFGAIVGFGSSLLTGAPQWRDALLGAAVGGFPLFLIDIVTRLTLGKEGMGGGDVKLMAMAGLFLGVKAVLLALVLGIVAGGIAGVVLLATRRVKRGGYFPIGPFLTAGVFISMLFSSGIVQLYSAFNEFLIKTIVG